MNLTKRQGEVFDCVLKILDSGKPATTANIAKALGAKRQRAVQSMLGKLRQLGLLVFYPTLREWGVMPPDEPELPDTWNMSRAAAFGVSVLVVDEAPSTGELRQVGFDYEFLWPRSQTHRIDWQTDLNRAVRKATREVIQRAARGMQIPEVEAELYLVRHATVRREAYRRRESEAVA